MPVGWRLASESTTIGYRMVIRRILGSRTEEGKQDSPNCKTQYAKQ